MLHFKLKSLDSKVTYRCEVEDFINGLKLLSVLITISSNLLAELLCSQISWDLQVKPRWWVNLVDDIHPHFGSFEFKSRFCFSCEAPHLVESKLLTHLSKSESLLSIQLSKHHYN